MGYPFIPIVDCDSVAYAASGAVKDDEPLNFALHNAKKQMEAIQDVFDRGLEMQVYLTGKSNFRDTIAVTQPYKGNRTQPKPQYLPDVRQYLVDMWGAKIVEGKEADDTVAIEYLKDPDNRCIVAIDKDLLQIPGWHYNYKKLELFQVPEDEAMRFLYIQLLEGDRVDHVPGLRGIGAVKARKALEGLHGPEEWSAAVCSMYRQHIGAGWKEYLNEQAGLLYILQKEDEPWEATTLSTYIR